jgi:CheY-like chemotaxis protein
VRILYVDDSSADAMLVRRLLAKSAIDVELVHCMTREEAVEHVRSGAFDLVLLDDYLGLVRGEQALEALIGAGYSGPTVMLTGVIREGAEASLSHLGCNVWLDKNHLDPQALEDAIRKVT